MFVHEDDFPDLLLVLRAYVEEWGPENVTISVPTNWLGVWDGDLGPVKLEYVTDNTVSIGAGGRVFTKTLL